jgi:hypothetical protein
MKTITVPHYPIFSIEFLSSYLVTMRPYLLFVSGITGFTGMALSSNNDLIKLSLIFIASFLSYGFGQALTDCFRLIPIQFRPPTGRLRKGK